MRKYDELNSPWKEATFIFSVEAISTERSEGFIQTIKYEFDDEVTVHGAIAVDIMEVYDCAVEQAKETLNRSTLFQNASHDIYNFVVKVNNLKLK